MSEGIVPISPSAACGEHGPRRTGCRSRAARRQPGSARILLRFYRVPTATRRMMQKRHSATTRGEEKFPCCEHFSWHRSSLPLPLSGPKPLHLSASRAKLAANGEEPINQPTYRYYLPNGDGEYAEGFCGSFKPEERPFLKLVPQSEVEKERGEALKRQHEYEATFPKPGDHFTTTRDTTACMTYEALQEYGRGRSGDPLPDGCIHANPRLRVTVIADPRNDNWVVKVFPSDLMTKNREKNVGFWMQTDELD